ncbi:outer membrane protein assembly factor BamD [Parabacteroides sp. FAFU027]|uniref:outer membrane protein assembly factor BamD n=1 Tax=Parabacteroides sp. FAFU027 TaxID=2922715 RepID=UPI001FAF0F8F|nr:outer membrane protein assembly factor BamD [Parabacteroides sp. FAFU027]
MKKNIFALLAFLLIATSCSEFNKVLKSSDYDYKFEYAKKCYENKKFYRCYTLLEELVPIYKGTEKAEESLYLLAQSYYGSKDYTTAAQSFTTYYNTYPKGQYAELARFYAAYSYYMETPDPRLDQTDNDKARAALVMFLEYYPHSEKAEEAQNLLFELQERLAYKELLNAKLYYDLGPLKMSNSPENNYLSSIIVAQNALKDYPLSKYKEDFFFLVLRAKYAQAVNSVQEKRIDRYRDVIDEYYNYKNEFPEGKHIKEATNMLEHAQKVVKN